MEAKWIKMKPELLDAYSMLVAQLKSSNSSQDLLDAYLAAKRLAADAYQALLRSNIPDHEASWKTVRQTLEYEMNRRYGSVLPEWALKVPYNSVTHQELFALLAERIGESVPADFLRIVTADAVHAERRVRELRELGLDIVSAKVADADTYTLTSFEVNVAYVHSIAANTIKANKKISSKERETLLESLNN
ncbi:hypothetical protein [Streptosporangium sandarakinum]|uniref:hypothetical protein n=1 Tax=Streptosporangium sandarakinum TaxID=1260955 RepID=UPI003425FB4F